MSDDMYTVENVLRSERLLANAEPLYVGEDELDRFTAVARELLQNHCVEMRAAALWNRKGYLDGGAVDEKLGAQSYRRGTHGEAVVVSVSFVVPDYTINHTDGLLELLNDMAANERSADADRKAAARRVKEGKLAELEAQAAALRAELS
ncbi:MAG: hypothetical protein E6R04_11070 [Spirochaetes bacterium]|nr:MAG: hypothetical protein E6R04_11070 [Spirochaetota bacterium]